MKYDILMIDPPWKKQKGGLRKVRPKQLKEFDYPTMEINEIFRLLDKEIFSLADKEHCVFMWCIDKYLCEIDKWMFERGYKKHCIFIWDKTNGIAPAFTIRFSHEYLIWYYKPRLLKINENARGKFLTVFREKSTKHSRKPDFAYEMINMFYPCLSKIDVFARRRMEGWDAWGNEVESEVQKTIRGTSILPDTNK